MKTAFPQADTELVKGGGGDFIVTVDGHRELWNKNASGRGFPDGEEIIDLLSDDPPP